MVTNSPSVGLPSLVHSYKSLFLLSISPSYSLWYRKSCPQPPQPNLIPSPICNVGPLTLISNNIPSNQLSFVIVGSNSNDPLPYSSYQFQVSATNSEGSVNSTTSESAVTTLPSGKYIMCLFSPSFHDNFWIDKFLET